MKSLRTILLLCFAIGSTLPGRAQSSPEEELVTKIYIVPGFSDPASMDPGERRPRATLALERAGIEFPSGTSAIYNPATTELIVRHTAEGHSRVRAHLAAMKARRSQLQIHLTRDEEPPLEGAVFPEAAEAIQRADEFALTARRLFYEGAFAALRALPGGGAAAPRRQAYEKQKSRAWEATERQRRETRVCFAREGETREQIAAEAGVAPARLREANRGAAPRGIDAPMVAPVRLREANRLDGQTVKAGQMFLLPPAAEAP